MLRAVVISESDSGRFNLELSSFMRKIQKDCGCTIKDMQYNFAMGSRANQNPIYKYSVLITYWEEDINED